MRACILIPHYNHARQIGAVLAALEPLQLPVIVVDDGSDEHEYSALKSVAAARHVRVFRQRPNRGKGAAVMRGLALARDAGYTHAVQIDADGQHCIDDVARLLAQARERPDALISGLPQFDASAPAARRHGRRISVFWARVTTWSLDIEDAMCGFRVYPVAPTLALTSVGMPGPGRNMRMEFDGEVLVRAHWAGMPLRFVPTAVVYPPDGLSHFRLWRDNVRISAMYTRLFFGMLLRTPLLIARRIRRMPQAMAP